MNIHRIYDTRSDSQRPVRYRLTEIGCTYHDFWIDVDVSRKEINLPATGDVFSGGNVDNLIRAIQYANDLAAGRITID